MAADDGKLTIYLPPGLKAEMKILPSGSISKICQRALRDAIAKARQERDEAITEAFQED